MGQHQEHRDKWGKLFFVFVRTLINSYGLLGQILPFLVQYKGNENNTRGQKCRWQERSLWSECVCCWYCPTAALPSAGSGARPVPAPWSCVPDRVLPFQDLSGCPCSSPTLLHSHQHHMWSSSETWQRRGEARQCCVEGYLHSGWHQIWGAGIGFLTEAFGFCVPSCSFMWLLSSSSQFTGSGWNRMGFCFISPPSSLPRLHIRCGTSH